MRALASIAQSAEKWHSEADPTTTAERDNVLNALLLAERFTVVCADLRGYGDSDKPPGTGDHVTYSKRVMAQDQLAVMHALGHERFGVAAHDRGARVALRLALYHPDAVSRLGDPRHRAHQDDLPDDRSVAREDRVALLLPDPAQ